MYKVLTDFYDLQDGNHFYRAGDTFPRDGVTVTAGRIEELSGDRNKRRIPLIAEDKPADKKPAQKKSTRSSAK